MKNNVLGWTLVALCVAVFAPWLTAQQARVSPHETHSSIVDGATITITYGRPSMRGRKIFGGLISYGRIWMPGADEATIIQTTKDLQFDDILLPAGSYSLYTLTGETSWKFIINKQTGQFHTVYNQDRDFARLDPTIDTLPQPVEQLTIAAVPALGSEGGGRLQLDWETTRLWVPFTVKR
jgi:hypothetical protein